MPHFVCRPVLAYESLRSFPQGGIMRMIGSGHKESFYEFASQGMTPVQNGKYDLHYLFNQILYRSRKRSDYLPGEVRVRTRVLGEVTRAPSHSLNWTTTSHLKVKRFLKWVVRAPGSSGWMNTLVDELHLSDAHMCWWCEVRA